MSWGYTDPDSGRYIEVYPDGDTLGDVVYAPNYPGDPTPYFDGAHGGRRYGEPDSTASEYARMQRDLANDDAGWWSTDLPDQGHAPRGRALLVGVVFVVVVMVVITSISHLHGW
jgi:hypothetical protein